VTSLSEQKVERLFAVSYYNHPTSYAPFAERSDRHLLIVFVVLD
jgi:hypothetical protein